MRILWLGIALMALLGMAPAQMQTRHGDLDGSGEIDAVDLVLLANYQAGNADDLPAQYGQVIQIDSVVGLFRFVPAGAFVQGSPEDEACRGEDETQFTHALTRNLAVMETEVTQDMWAALQALQPTLPDVFFQQTGTNYPADTVKWQQAILFANLLSFQRHLTRCYYKDALFQTPVDASNYSTGTIYWKTSAAGFRLPTEGEWERFARAGTTGAFWLNEPALHQLDCANCTPGYFDALETAGIFCANSGGEPAGVAGKRRNPWGLFDTNGNLDEWCWDWYGAYPTGEVTDYAGPASGTDRVIRGGSFSAYMSYLRSASRDGISTEFGWNSVGFRLVRTVF